MAFHLPPTYRSAAQSTPVLALTASADIESIGRVSKLLHMEKATKVTVSPTGHIRLGLSQVPADNLNCLDWIVKEARDKGKGTGGKRLLFRKWCGKVGELRSLLPSPDPVLAVTATASKATRKNIMKHLGSTVLRW
ncbi:uncharacterized protein ACWYII_047134 isoform 1-T1 [Salvelinus alpinus]